MQIETSRNVAKRFMFFIPGYPSTPSRTVGIFVGVQSLRLASGNTYQNKMAAGFSGALQLTDLDDFITPSQVSTMLLYVIKDRYSN